MESSKMAFSPTVKSAAFPRGHSATVVEQMRRRHVQAELRLRELEDRFRRDCNHQEQEVEMLKMENSKLKAKIEDQRMIDSAAKTTMRGGTAVESDLLKGSSRKYRTARETVEAARDEVQEIQAKLASTRQRLQDLRRQHGTIRRRTQTARLRSIGGKLRGDTQMDDSRSQLRGLEFHVETESDRAARLMDEAKELRRAIDVQLNLQNQSEDTYRDRESHLMDILNEISFLMEVCNALFEERDAAQQQLTDLQNTANVENESYEKMFRELIAVEERDKEVKAKLRDSTVKLQEELVEITTERETKEKDVREDKLAMELRARELVTGGASATDDDGALSLARQLEEFERYFSRLAELVGSDDIDVVERYVCNCSEERFQLYTALNAVQDSIVELQREYEDTRSEKESESLGNGEEKELRAEITELEAKLNELQQQTLHEEQQAVIARSQLDEAVPLVQTLFDSLGCDNSDIVAKHGVSTATSESICEYLCAIEQRLEEYTAVWFQRHGDLGIDFMQLPQRVSNKSNHVTLKGTTTGTAVNTLRKRHLPRIGDAEETSVDRSRSFTPDLMDGTSMRKVLSARNHSPRKS